MKQWAKKLIDQLNVQWDENSSQKKKAFHQNVHVNEEKATLLYILDIYSKHLFEINKWPLRKTREQIDQLAKALLTHDDNELEKNLFQLRQFFSTYRLDESSYVQNTLEDFKKIILEFAENLSEDIRFEKIKDDETAINLASLREAAESNSLEDLKAKSKGFIDFYVKYQEQKSHRREKRMHSIRKSLTSVKEQLETAHDSMRVDHLTSAFNRRYFDEQLNKICQHQQDESKYVLMILDIDHFKKINDNYGHDIGDFVLKECVKSLKNIFGRKNDILARIGGEEFAVILHGYDLTQACVKAEQALEKIRKEVYVQGESIIRFTVSMGLASFKANESAEAWLRRADQALYQSKNTGRNKWTVASDEATARSVA